MHVSTPTANVSLVATFVVAIAALIGFANVIDWDQLSVPIRTRLLPMTHLLAKVTTGRRFAPRPRAGAVSPNKLVVD